RHEFTASQQYVALAVYFVSRQPGERSLSDSTGEPLVKYDSAAVDKLEIRSMSGTVLLERQGAKWMIISPTRYPADEGAVTAAVGKGKELRVTNLASSNPAKQEIYSVDSTATLVQVFTNNNLAASFRVGKPSSSYTETYVRKEGSNDVYSVSGVLTATFMKGANDWRDKTIFKTNQNNINSVKFQFGDTTFVLTKKDSTNWVIGNDSTVTSTVTAFLGALSNLQSDEFVDSTISSSPKLTAIIETQGAQIKIYRRQDGRHYVQTSGSPQWFAIQEWKAGQLLKRRKDFLPSLPTKK
ncbi:MAG: DUF4340 domain-containing protein, partial [bacterium]